MNFFARKHYEYFRAQNHVFSDLVAISPATFELRAGAPGTDRVSGEYVVGDFFRALGVQPAIGRLIGPDDDQDTTSDPAVAVISWDCWKNRFDLNPSVVNARIVLDGVPATIVGVTAREFFGIRVGFAPEIWVPTAMNGLIHPADRPAAGQLGMGLIGRLKPGVSIEQARAEMRVLDKRRDEEIAASSHDARWLQTVIDVEPAAAGLSQLRERLAKPVLMLMGIVALLLLIACTNVAGMLLARAAVRRREMAVRVTLGATRTRLIRQLLTESILLSAAGALIGITFAYDGAGALVRAWPVDPRLRLMTGPLELQVRPDLRVLFVTGAVALFTGVVFGLAPAWTAISSSLSPALREVGTAGETRSRRFFGRGLVIGQVALSVVLVSAAGLFVRHLTSLRYQDLGFDRESVLLVTLDPVHAGYSREQLAGLYSDLIGRFEGIHGVRSATLAAVTPIEGGAASRYVQVEGFVDQPSSRERASLNWVGPKYFQTLGIRQISGRDFIASEQNGPPAAIVNEAFVRHYFGRNQPLGKRFRFDGQERQYEIVGVVGDAKYSSLHDPPPRTIFLHAFQEARGRFSEFAIRTEGPPARVAADVRAAAQNALKSVPISKMTTLGDQVDGSTKPERLIAILSALFGGLGAGLAAIGLYGLLAYTVARRTSEIGVRIALGATPRDVTVMVLKGAAALVGAGLVVGAPLAIWGKRFASSAIEGLPSSPGGPLVLAALAMVGVALVAAYVPARRAARVDPIEALRRE
jgi:predicted permease